MGRAEGSSSALADIPARRGRGKVAVDWDATAWSYLDALMRHPACTPEFREQLHPNNCNHWNVPVDTLGLEAMEEVRTMELMLEIGVFPGFFDSMHQLRADGFEPVILTHNSEQTLGIIKEFIEKHDCPMEVLRARPADKIAWCLENDCPVLFDDSPETILLAAEAEIKIVTYRFHYNAEAIDKTGALHAPQGSHWNSLLALGMSVLGRDRRAA